MNHEWTRIDTNGNGEWERVEGENHRWTQMHTDGRGGPQISQISADLFLEGPAGFQSLRGTTL